MSYGAKYRIEFIDTEGIDIKSDISEDGFSDSVTSITPTANPLTIEWPGTREDIFASVRGSFATLNVFATTTGQFNELFDATEKQYKMQVYYDSSIYWTGWVMVGDHVESLSYPPYDVTIKAYDLGYLQSVVVDETESDKETLINVLNNILDLTELELSIKERVNIYEDTITGGAAANSLFNQIEMHQKVFFNEDFETTTAYNALSIILTSFNAFIMQENNYWNICRVQDMRESHYYRVFNTSGSVTSSGTEDTTTSLSSQTQLNNTMLMMSCPAWYDINITQDLGYKNMIFNGFATNNGLTATDLWTQNTAGSDLSYASTTRPATRGGYNYLRTLRLSGSASGIGSFIHDKTYKVYEDWYFRFKMKFLFYSSTYDATELKVKLKLVTAGFTYYLIPSTGAWTTIELNAKMTGLTEDEWTELDIVTDALPADGTLSLEIFEPEWVSPGSSAAYIYYDSIELYLENHTPITSETITSKDYSEVIDTDNTVSGDALTLYLGDADDTSYLTGDGIEQFDCYDGCLEVSSSSVGTDAWQSNLGSVVAPLAEICANNYKAQYINNARRLQGTIKDLDYLDVLIHDSKYFLSSSISRNFADSTLNGEWIEIKSLWGDDITGTFEDGEDEQGYADNGGSFSTSANEINIEKVTTSEIAKCSLGSTSVTSGVRYKLVITITDNGTSDIPEFNFAGSNTSSLVLGENTWEVVSDATKSTHLLFTESDTAETCDLTIGVFIYEIVGG